MIKIVKNQIDKKLYCMCCECYMLWKSIDDIKSGKYLDIREIPYYKHNSEILFNTSDEADIKQTEKHWPNGIPDYDKTFIEASEEDIISAGWPLIKNKVTLCRICYNPDTFYTNMDYLHLDIKKGGGWILIKKDLETNELFCKCDNCGAVWKDIKAALHIWTSPHFSNPPVDTNITRYRDALDEEIAERGWDIYNDVW